MSSKILSLGTLVGVAISLIIGGFLGAMVGSTLLAVTTTSSITTTLTTTSTSTSITTTTNTATSYITSTLTSTNTITTTLTKTTTATRYTTSTLTSTVTSTSRAITASTYTTYRYTTITRRTTTTVTTTFTSTTTVTSTLTGVYAVGFNGQNQYFQVPSFSVSGGTASLFNYVAITYGSITVVTWVYLNSGDWGPILGFSSGQPTAAYPEFYTPWLYISSNGIVYAGDIVPSCFLFVCSGGSIYYVQSNTPISPGWHMITVEEGQYSSNTYFIKLYIDGEFMEASTISGTPQLFNAIQYGYIGVAYAANTPPTPWPGSWLGWKYFNGYIAEVIIYPYSLSGSQVSELFNAGIGNPPIGDYVGLYLGSSYDPTSALWHDLTGNHYDLYAFNGPSITIIPVPQ